MKGNPAGGPFSEYADVVERLQAFDHVGFFLASATCNLCIRRKIVQEALPIHVGLDAVLALLREG